MLDVEFAHLSDPGRIRDNNEDYLGHVLPEAPEDARLHGWLFALADGVGGQQAGEIASSLAVEELLSGFRRAVPGESYTALLPRLVQSANLHVYEHGVGSGRTGRAMATTVVACALRYDRAVISHVGDSRCYLIRQGYVVALTRDHTLSSEQQRLGLITSREAAAASTAHVLSRALGNEMFVSVDTSEHQVFPGDVLLLCSDGLHHSVGPEDLAEHITASKDLRTASQRLVSLAKERDGSDNISVQVIRVRTVERVGMYRGRHYQIP